MESFFVLPSQHEELARDEIISISKSYDPKTRIKSSPRLVFLENNVPWKKIASRSTFSRYSGEIIDTFDDISSIDPPLIQPESFVCRTINLSSKKIGTSLERQAGGILKRKWGSKVSLANPHLTIYIIVTDDKKYLGIADGTVSPVHPIKAVKHPHELDMKLGRCLVNLSSLKEEKTLCDPFCGTGTILLEAQSMGINAIGIDYDKIMCKITSKNLAANKFCSRVVNAEYSKMLEFKDEIDSIVTDLPYGISSRSSMPPNRLVKDFVSIIPKRKKLVMVYKKGLEIEEMSKAKKYEIYRHKSLTRVIAVS
jgi:tRNA (guanine10-N2)-dimethyltransferase